jgi:hypothetical protein
VTHAAPDPAERSRSPWPWAAAAILLFGATLAMRWPGVAMYDSVSQYEQALDGDYADWHPPIMARTWALLNQFHPGTEPFFLLQMLLWWGGLGLLAAALGRRQRHNAAAAVLLVGIMPLWLGWATVVLKDAQMACCLIGAAGLAAHWRLADRPIPRPIGALILLLVGYATLVRGNALFATVPFALGLFGWPGLPRQWQRVGAALALMAGVIALSPIINHRLFKAEASGVEHALPLYDLAGIADRGHLATLPGLPPAQWAAAEAKGCYTPYFWNPYGEDRQCGAIGDAEAFDDAPSRLIMRRWIGAVLGHPLAYAAHRLGHLNANLRFWVDAREPDALPPVESEPNTDGLGARSNPGGQGLIALAGVLIATPLGWPFAWALVAAGLLAVTRAADDPQVRLGRVLALSALVMFASFAVVSIASDLRYHLWSMVAAALALVLLGDARAADRRRGTIMVALVLGGIAIGTVARLGLAQPVYVPLPPHAPPVSPRSH